MNSIEEYIVNHPLHIVEIVLISFIILRQFYLFFQSKARIKRLKDLDLHTVGVINTPLTFDNIRECNDDEIFHEVLEARQAKEDGIPIPQSKKIVVIPLLYSDNKISETAQIIKELNRYIVKNDGQTVNFHIIQDIVERNYQVLDDEINHTMPTPLYLGLAATMLGIIFGLAGMSFTKADDVDIMLLIQGVGIAMVASFIGLSLTTILSTFFYKKSKTEAEKEKNLFFSKLQAELLPELLRQGISGIEGLSRQLKSFAGATKESTNQLVAISEQTQTTLVKQNELIKRIENLNIAELSTASMMVFDRLESNLESFKSFSNHWEALINSISQTEKLVIHLETLVSKITGVDQLAEGIKRSIEEYRSTMNFFTKHIASFEQLEESAVSAVQKCDTGVADAVNSLLKNIHDRMKQFEDHNTTIDVELKDAGVALRESVHQATQTQLSLLTQVYSEKIPAFDKLNVLPEIEASAANISKRFSEQNPVSNSELMQKFDNLEEVLGVISKNLIALEKIANQGINVSNASLSTNGHEMSTRKTLLKKVEQLLIIGAAASVIAFIVFILIVIILPTS
ncbi:MotA/TolQ/ExbB proton channel family protein [Draconibacterium sediminis]|nr:MotA/TolQ/ExbB proton channel family protein [Draconibacterium sediminis]